ncbi:MAG: AraC family transcriptional regulator [Rheinheimera sp.]|nr:MAG: AraC family transcriptional regulator [Rheinheimera sp.]
MPPPRGGRNEQELITKDQQPLALNQLVQKKHRPAFAPDWDNMNAKVRAASIAQLAEVCPELGVALPEMLQCFGLNEAMLQNTELLIPALPAVQLLEQVAADSGCESVGLRLAERRRLSGFGMLGILLAHQATLGEGLAAIACYRHLLNDILMFQLEESPPHLLIRLDLLLGAECGKTQAIELALGITWRFCLLMAGAQWQPLSVHFSHAEPADLKYHKKFFRCPVHFNSDFNGIVVPLTARDLLNPQADSLMVRHAEQLLAPLLQSQNRPLADEIRQLLLVQLPAGRYNIELIAGYLGLQPRSLQRRLAAEQLSFSELLNDVRLELCRHYLQNPLYSLQRIGDLLGYANASSFTRWFVLQFGKSPSEYRQEQARRPLHSAK